MNPLQQIQQDSEAWLLGNPATAQIPITSFRKEIIASVADEAQAAWRQRDGVDPATIGVACLILMPRCKPVDNNVPGPQLEIEITIRTFEDPKINTTGMTAEDVALAHLNWLDGLLIEDLTELHASGEDALRPNYDYPGFLVYDSILRGKLPQSWIGRTAPPQFADTIDGLVTLSCDDPAASIYYTVGGSIQPGLLSQLYTAPFTVPLGTAVRAIAWNPQTLPSHIAKAIITGT